MNRLKRYVIRDALIHTGSESLNGDISIEGEKISGIAPSIGGSFEMEFDLGGRHLIPGIVDPHVHFNLSAGAGKSADDFLTGSRAGLFGGVTTTLDFLDPNIGLTLQELFTRRNSEARTAMSDFGFHATLCGWNPSWKPQVEWCLSEGISTFKFFTAYEESGRRTRYEDLLQAAFFLKAIGACMLIHAEDQESLKIDPHGMGDGFERYTLSRPPVSEAVAIRKLRQIQSETGVRMYIVHTNTGAGVDAAAGTDIMLETCPHYLVLDDSKYQEPDGYRYAVAPPLRPASDRSALWDAIIGGRIQTIGTDHCPFGAALQKEAGNHYLKAPFGLPGVETSLPLMVTYGIETGRIDWTMLVRLMCENPASIMGLHPRKGCLREGSDADFVVLDDRFQIVEPSFLHSRTSWNPYTGLLLTGWPAVVASRGEIVINAGQCTASAGRGSFIARQFLRPARAD